MGLSYVEIMHKTLTNLSTYEFKATIARALLLNIPYEEQVWTNAEIFAKKYNPIRDFKLLYQGS